MITFDSHVNEGFCDPESDFLVSCCGLRIIPAEGVNLCRMQLFELLVRGRGV